MKNKPPKSKTSVSVERAEGPGVSVGLKFRFDPEQLGLEQTQEVWNSLGQLLAALFKDDPAGRAEFLRQFEKQRKKGAGQ